MGLSAATTAPSEQAAFDQALVERAQAGELEAFEELVARHERWVYTLTRRITSHAQDAEDATQQAFLSALENLGHFRGEASFAQWLRRIATHAALKILRKKQGLRLVSLDATPSPHPEDEAPVPRPEYIACWRQTPDQIVRQRETARLIEQALQSLDENHRIVFVLRDVEGFSIEETATILGIQPSNVKIRLLRARLRLREILTRTFGDPQTQVPVPPEGNPHPIVTSSTPHDS